MAKLHQIGRTIIRVYANDHLPPHFHVITPDYEALVEIATLEILKGAIPARVRKPVMEWAKANIDVIKTEWNRVNRFEAL